MNTLFWFKVRENPALRIICLPMLRAKREFEFRKYQDSEDSQHIRLLKNSCEGERCFIIGNGPSLTKEDLDLLIHEKTFAFNRIYSMYQYTDWRPTYYMSVDSSVMQMLYHEKEKELGAKYVFFASKKLVRKYKSQNACHVIVKGVAPICKNKPLVKNLSENVSEYFSIAQSVTIYAFQLAFYMGFSEIYLLGVDHSFPVEIDINGKKHINRNTDSHFKEDNDKSSYISHKDALTYEYEICRKYADEHGRKVFNVTRGGNLNVFEREILENVL